jgi:NAD(P)-dependent dehydrogenase (short-subunit alcohol dehydrogenase family)
VNPEWSVPEDRVVLVTGGNAGIGYFVSEQLARAGATVVIASRGRERGLAAETALRTQVPEASVRHLRLDLASQASVRDAAEEISAYPRLDAMVLNAGVLTQGRRQETADGHELVFGTNHLGHAGLVARVLPALSAAQQPARIVTVGSFGARWVKLDFADLKSSRGRYFGFRAYLRSKLAQMVWAAELDRRLRAAGSPVQSILAHPGGALDGLTDPRPPVLEHTLKLKVLGVAGLAFAAQSKEAAAWPLVRAALDPDAVGGQLYGPRYLRSRGPAVLEKPPASMADLELGARTWAVTADLLGLSLPI